MLGQRIGTLRIARGMSQVDLAKKLCVTKQTVSNWENENILPSVEMLLRLANVFSVSTDYLLGIETIPRLDIAGLPDEVVAHVAMLINDLRCRE